MAATKGNRFWELRSKSGRDKIFSDPKEVWESAVEYFNWCIDNPISRVDVVKAGEMAGTQIGAEVPRPFTLEGVCSFLDITTNTFRNYEQDEKNYKDFFDTFTRIRETIRRQKLEGALCGNYHANLVARELGMGESIDHTSNGKEIKNIISFGGKEIEV